MTKLSLPKNPHKGLKIFCRTCRVDNSKCRHYDRQVYRVRIHVPGTKNSSKSFYLEAVNYNDAILECALIEKELIQAIYQMQINNEQISIKAINKIIGVQQKDTITQNKSRSDYFLRINQKFKLATRASELLIVKQREETDKRIYNYNINPDFIDSIKTLILNNQ
jgi:hypothetical protein